MGKSREALDNVVGFLIKQLPHNYLIHYSERIRYIQGNEARKNMAINAYNRMRHGDVSPFPPNALYDKLPFLDRVSLYFYTRFEELIPVDYRTEGIQIAEKKLRDPKLLGRL